MCEIELVIRVELVIIMNVQVNKNELISCKFLW